MTAWRVVITGSVLLASGLAGLDKAQAQQGYEFGIRFQPINFGPTNFKRFSFPGYGFRPASAQPIQFNKISFPAFNSRAVRQDFEKSRDRGRLDQSIAFQGRRDRIVRSGPPLRVSQHRGPAIPTLSNRRQPEGVARLGVPRPLPERTRRLARGKSDGGASSPSSRFADFGQLGGPSSRVALAGIRRPFADEDRATVARTRVASTVSPSTGSRARTAISVSPRTVRRPSISTDTRSASRLRGDAFSSAAIR